MFYNSSTGEHMFERFAQINTQKDEIKMATKPKYNPDIHHRQSIRLKGYDYSSPGAYFVTICLQNRAHLFGKVENGIILLNDAGIMVDKWYRKLPSKFPDIQCCFLLRQLFRVFRRFS
jgi:hypothetical protein